MRFSGFPCSGRRGAQSLIGAVLMMTAASGSAMTVMADAFPGSGQVVAGPVLDDAAGSAGGVGPVPAGDFDDAVAATTHPFGQAGAAAPAPAGQGGAPGGSRGLVPAQFEPALMLAVGLGFITGVSLLRSRQRRRRGWGMLPERGPDGGLRG